MSGSEVTRPAERAAVLDGTGVRHSGPSDVNKTEAGGPARAGGAAPNLKSQACLRKDAAVRLSH